MTLDNAYKIVMPFGKHKGATLRDIADGDLHYLEWLRDNVELRHPLDDAVDVILNANGHELED